MDTHILTAPMHTMIIIFCWVPYFFIYRYISIIQKKKNKLKHRELNYNIKGRSCPFVHTIMRLATLWRFFHSNYVLQAEN